MSQFGSDLFCSFCIPTSQPSIPKEALAYVPRDIYTVFTLLEERTPQFLFQFRMLLGLSQDLSAWGLSDATWGLAARLLKELPKVLQELPTRSTKDPMKPWTPLDVTDPLNDATLFCLRPRCSAKMKRSSEGSRFGRRASFRTPGGSRNPRGGHP